MLRLGVPLIVLVAALAAAVMSDRPSRRADFTFINKNDVTTLDPQKMSWMQDLRVARLVFEGLVRNDVFSRDYRIVPAAAERWDVSPDGLEYTFHLRADARWSNGHPVRASDFVYAWRRALLPETASDYSGLVMKIRGGRGFFERRQAALDAFARAQAGVPKPDRAAAAEQFWNGTLADFERTVGVRAVDERTLRVELERPTPYFLELCAMPVFFPVYPPSVQRFSRLNADTGMMEDEPGWTKPPEIVGNGPFVLTEWRFKREMRFAKNPAWWNAASLSIGTISIPSIEDANAAVMAFRTGAVDWITDVVARYTPDMLDRKRDYYREHEREYRALGARGLDPVEVDRRLPPDPRKGLHVFPAFGTYFLNFNCSPTLLDGRPNPFADPRVRRAFTMAVDKREIADEVRRLGEPVSATLIPPGAIAGYRSPRGVGSITDATTPVERAEIIARARSLLADAGYPDPSAFLTVDMLFTKDGGHDVIFEAVAKQWQEHLGVPVSLSQKEIKVFREDARKHNFIVSRASWYGDYGDPTTFLDINKTGDGNNDRNYSNAEYDRLLDRAEVERDPSKRMEILNRAEELMLNDAPLLPLFTYAQIYCFDPNKFTGISSHPRSDQYLHLIDVFGDGHGTDEPLALPAIQN